METISVMKTCIRVMALVLACLFCVMAVAACKDDIGTGTKEGTGVDGELHTGEDGKIYDEWGKLMDNLPSDLDYRGERIKVLYWADVEKPEFEQSEEVDDSRLSAIYNRNLAIQQRLGVTLQFSSVNGNAGNLDSFVSYVDNARTSGTHDFDIIGTYSRTAGSLCAKNLLYDLSTIEDSYIELDQPWWPDNLTDEMKIGNSVYFLSGDISITVIDEVHCIYFNKGLVNEKFEADATAEGLADGTALLYSYVRNGTWTVEKMVEMCSGYYNDADMDGNVSSGDIFAMCSKSYCAAAFYGSANLRMLMHDDTDVLKISPDYTSARAVTLCQRLGQFMDSDDYWTGKDGTYYINPFRQGNALFAMQYLEMAEDFLIGNDAVAHYGLLPLPKYNADQKHYYSVIGNAFTIYGLFSDFDDRDDKAQTLSMFTAVLECWASEGYRKTTPVVFELNMQLKYSETQDETDMCEYVRSGIRFDLGRIFDSALGQSLDGAFISACENSADWSSTYEPYIDSVTETLADLIASLRGTSEG